MTARHCPRCNHYFNPGENPEKCPSCGLPMISDLTCAKLCDAIYGRQPDPPFRWDVIDQGLDDGVYWGLARFGDVDVVVLRGSVTVGDWLRDFVAVADPFTHDKLGPVHPGFALGMEKMCGEVLRLAQPKVIVTGHSLGAGRACILSALMKLAGCPPLRRVCFGEPLPGFAPLAALLADIPTASYRNGSASAHEHDLITDIPFAFGLEQYVHPIALTDVYSQPAADDPWGSIRWHHAPLYVEALARPVEP